MCRIFVGMFKQIVSAIKRGGVKTYSINIVIVIILAFFSKKVLWVYRKILFSIKYILTLVIIMR